MVSNSENNQDKQPSRASEGSLSGNDPWAPFDLWAVAVRRQMLASLKKRESKRGN